MKRKRGLDLLPGRLPRVYVGPNAEGALHGERGVLLGARRASWVDVLEFECCPHARVRALVDLRFSSATPWDVVGLSLSSREVARRRETLLRELVPGDVILTETGARIHTGTAWVEAPVQGARRGRTT